MQPTRHSHGSRNLKQIGGWVVDFGSVSPELVGASVIGGEASGNEHASVLECGRCVPGTRRPQASCLTESSGPWIVEFRCCGRLRPCPSSRNQDLAIA